MTSLPDINTLIYAVDENAKFHGLCAEWLARALHGPSDIGFTWHTLAGFVRISTHRKIMKIPLRVDEAFNHVDLWLARPPARILGEGKSHLVNFRRFIETAGTGGNLVSDAHIAAIAMEHHGEIVSCDTDFAKFPGLHWFNPATGSRSRP